MSMLFLAALAAPPPALVLSAGPAAGEAAPAFRLRALDGRLVKLDELAYPGKEKSWAKKRAVLLDFFRTDCAPCREALPELDAIRTKYADRGLDIIIVALLESERGKEKLDAFLAERPLPFTVLVDATEHFAKKYLGPSAKLPATFLIDPDGRVLRAKHGGGRILETFGADLDGLRKIAP